MRFVFGIVLIVLGLVMLFKPIVIWKIQSSLFVKNGEPTRFYYIVARVAGAFAVAVGILVVIYA